MNIDGISSRFQAIWHKIIHPTHKLIWRSKPVKGLCEGDIVCETCDIIFWCRYYDLSQKQKDEIDYDNL